MKSKVEWLVQKACELRPGHDSPFAKEDLLTLFLTLNLELLTVRGRVEKLENELRELKSLYPKLKP